jgi:hypothetical protein
VICHRNLFLRKRAVIRHTTLSFSNFLGGTPAVPGDTEGETGELGLGSGIGLGLGLGLGLEIELGLGEGGSGMS